MAENNWELELNEYIRQGEPDNCIGGDDYD